MISASIDETGRIEVNFKEKELAGLKAILSGKGFSFSFIYLFMMCMSCPVGHGFRVSVF